MKLIKPSIYIKEQEKGLEGVLKQIEWAGRHCYMSMDKITEDSAKGFVERMLKSGHGSVLEHGTVYLAIPFDYVDISCKLEVPIVSDIVEKYKQNPYTKWWLRDDIFSRLAFITTNLRVLYQGDYKTWEEAAKNNYDKNWLDDLKYMCEPTEYHEKRVTVKFIADEGVMREFNRHRSHSISQMSTRYCNFSKNKFNNEVTFIIPEWVKLNHYNVSVHSVGNNEIFVDGDEAALYNENDESTKLFLYSLKDAEDSYLKLLREGWTAQQARQVLSFALKTESIHTAFVSDWRQFFGLRCSPKAHPDAQYLANQLREEFIKRGL